MKTQIKFIIAVYILLFVRVLTAQAVDNNAQGLSVQPSPKKVVSLNTFIKLSGDQTIAVKSIGNIEERKACNYLNYILKDKLGQEIVELPPSSANVKIVFEKITTAYNQYNNQYYSINCTDNQILIRYKSQIGLLFAAVTFSEYFQMTDDGIKINLYNVTDYPDFSRRIISSNPKPDDVFELLDLALRNKIESIAIASRQYPWFEVSPEYESLFKKIKEWKDNFGGPSIMQMHNIYEEKDIEISNNKDIESLEIVIRTGIENGADKLMILADDTPPFKYGEGYVLTSENDKGKFRHMAEAHCYLMKELKNWLHENSLESELYYVPPFYTFEDMHYGDMELFKDTPWEDDAFKPFYRDLNFIGLNMPEDVYIIWCGKYVRSRKITRNDLNEWTYNLKGIVPFLWDNTIYSHHPFISTPMFSAWDNEFPSDFSTLTAGNGMYINGDANFEDSKVAAITANDYMWNSKTYSPDESLSLAMNRLYGKSGAGLLLQLKNTELELRKTIGQRALRFESDTLWTIIRKIRYIHSKNPFYYHFNYTRMKGLRLQLKGSVPEPAAKEVFIEECLGIDKKRQQIMNQLKLELPEVEARLEKILMKLPDWNTIQ